MPAKMIHMGIALFFFVSGCAVTLFFTHGQHSDLVPSAQASGGCWTVLKSSNAMPSGDECVYEFFFNRPVQNVRMSGNKVFASFDNRCQYNCQRFNPASGSCAGAHMNGCD